MAVTLSHSPAVFARPAPARRHARWWLAGLLVGCLLPAGLAQGDLARQAERLVQVCILAPAMIRASSRLKARRRRRGWWPLVRQSTLLPVGSPAATPVTVAQATADHDVLTRRGPPFCVDMLNS
ncbi:MULTISPECIES: hypothetical protein [Halomonas]|uniref:Uncharacterized protein n=2 Tax=Halomonas TaxID=2745 RepID=A0A7X5ALJ5_9GAMM|nr:MULTISPECIES: hypothetical protein [Halomonas]MDR5901374.1 hypothetical protein [Halomonas icarae]NAW11879.1 hypothetical protein [Halomonas icarae]TDB03110.1 hypothetical protein E0702_07405 [Halomonas marinisediminis]